ncbi:BUD13 homolog [Nephila pilipes]|uniref:BUD13 homolog n=1 Tax=Nephila pilipes TaxID=299642 RepID=A0A8X6QQI1_NEPPI|nr:BUD13 homolog [Nephila pilipes]
MASIVSKAEYLKRYLEDDKKTKRRKKIKTSNPLVPRMKIIDENIDLRAIKFGEQEIVEKEDAPVIAGIIDERPEEVKTKEMYQESKWKRLDSTNDENREFNATSKNLLQTKNRSRHDSDSDCSPPRKNQNMLSQKRLESESIISPPKNYSAKKRNDSDSDCSPPRRQKSSSVRKRRNDSDSDISPPRGNSHNRKRKGSMQSQHKKQDSDSDLSPERIRSFHHRKAESHSDSDLSPCRGKDASKYERNFPEEDSKRRPVKTLSGLKAGLQNAATLRTETQDLRNRERKQIEQLDVELSGRNAETVVRDRKTGKKRDIEEENQERLEKEKKLSEQQQKYAEWGKGIEQSESKKNKLSEDLYESSKPLARYQDDEDLEEQLKSKIHDDDPMAEFFKKKKGKSNVSVYPEYKGPPPPPNRFGIKPGYRWDGVDRSNGFERKYFEKNSSMKASEEEAYLWSVQDM